MGIVIQSVLEDLYNKEEWKHVEGLRERLIRTCRERLADACTKHLVQWGTPRVPTYEEMEEAVRTGVLGFLETMRHHKLLGAYARSEVDLLGAANKWLVVGGRADFLIRREDTGVTILDGKNSMTKMKHVNPDQLRWYALCFVASFNQMPDRLGFVWYRYPYNESTGEQGVDWVSYTKRDLQQLIDRAVAVRNGQSRGKFSATASHSACRFCDYESVCPERQAMRKANAAKRKGKSSLPVMGGELEELGFANADKA